MHVKKYYGQAISQKLFITAFGIVNYPKNGISNKVIINKIC